MDNELWYYTQKGKQQGPVSRQELLQLFATGALRATDDVWTEGMSDWARACDVPDLLPTPTPEPGRPGPAPSFAARPASLTVFGILNIIFGGLGLLCTPFSIFMVLVLPGAMNPTRAAMTWLVTSYLLGFVISILLVVLGIGLLKCRDWARRGTLYYGWFTIAWTLVATGMQIFLTSSGAYGYAPEAALGSIVGGAIGGLIGLIYPILLVIFMRQPAAVAACAR